MGRKIGKQLNEKTFLHRPFVCEIAAVDADVVVTPATVFADFAAVTFPGTDILVNPDEATICSLEVSLAPLGDEVETDTGVFVSTNCDLIATDVDADKVTNLEPSGSWGFPMQDNGASVPDFEIVVVQGSVASVCGKFCICIDAKGNAGLTFAGITSVTALVQEYLDGLQSTVTYDPVTGLATITQTDQTSCPVATNPELDCNDVPYPKGVPLSSVQRSEGLIRLASIECPEKCIPPDPPCLTGYYYQPDKHGGGWEWLGASPWIRCQKATCVVRSIETVTAGAVSLFQVAHQDVLASGEITLDNPTCDEMEFRVWAKTHNEVQLIRDDANTTNQSEGIIATIGGAPVVHSLFRYFIAAGGSRRIRIENDDYAEQRYTVAPKSSLTLPIELTAFRPHGSQDWRSSPYTVRVYSEGAVICETPNSQRVTAEDHHDHDHDEEEG